MKVLIGCEFSGTVRDAFTARGHYAMSCDLLPTTAPGLHYQGDVFDAIKMEDWDLAVFHPPCTYLTGSGERWFKDQPPRKSGVPVGADRRAERVKAITFFMALWECGIPRIAIENPIGVMSTVFRKPDQVVQPWMFGHGETKATCLWLKNTPPLIPTDIVEGREQRLFLLPNTPDRWALRSLTYPGIAQAMAEQWGSYTPPLSLFS